MKRSIIICAVALMAALASPAQGKTIVFSPVLDTVALATGAGAALSTKLLLDEPGPWEGGADAASLNPLDALACLPYDETVSNVSTVAAGVAMLWPTLFVISGGPDELLPAAAAFGEAMLWTYALKNLAKYLLPRARPYAYTSGSLPSELEAEAGQSFPSGHTALAFCAATCFAVFGIELAPEEASTPWLVAGGYALALATGALRVASGNHFITDVAAGAALGSGIGWLVTRLHIRNSGSREGPVELSATPVSFTVKVKY